MQVLVGSAIPPWLPSLLPLLRLLPTVPTTTLLPLGHHHHYRANTTLPLSLERGARPHPSLPSFLGA